VRIFVAVSLRFPPAGTSAEGEAVPKARPKGVVDGQQVHIPALLMSCPRGTHQTNRCSRKLAHRRTRAGVLKGAPEVFVRRKSLELEAGDVTVPRKARREIMI
jgi:hypothetical protein